MYGVVATPPREAFPGIEMWRGAGVGVPSVVESESPSIPRCRASPDYTTVLIVDSKALMLYSINSNPPPRPVHPVFALTQSDFHNPPPPSPTLDTTKIVSAAEGFWPITGLNHRSVFCLFELWYFFVEKGACLHSSSINK